MKTNGVNILAITGEILFTKLGFVCTKYVAIKGVEDNPQMAT